MKYDVVWPTYTIITVFSGCQTPLSNMSNKSNSFKIKSERNDSSLALWLILNLYELYTLKYAGSFLPFLALHYQGNINSCCGWWMRWLWILGLRKEAVVQSYHFVTYYWSTRLSFLFWAVMPWSYAIWSFSFALASMSCHFVKSSWYLLKDIMLY